MASDERQETVDAVIAEWRDCLNSAELVPWGDLRIAGLVSTTKSQQLEYLARVEAALKRERAAFDCECAGIAELAAKEEAARHKPGNSAAMREAMVEAIGETCAGCSRDCDDCMNLKSGWMKKAKAALSAPPRQCDVGTPEEQTERFNDFCESNMQQYKDMFGDGLDGWDCKEDCPIGKMIDCGKAVADRCQLAWAQTPYEAQEGAGE